MATHESNDTKGIAAPAATGTSPSQGTQKRIGLVGGLAFRAGIFYYEQLLQQSNRDGKPLDLVLQHADVDRVLGLVAAGDRASLGDYLGELSNHLFAAGADLVAVSAVAPHIAVRELQRCATGPVVDLLACVTTAIADAGLERVAILGNRAVIDSNAFGAVAEHMVVKLDDKTAQAVHNTYTDIALSGKRGTQPEVDYLSRLAHELIEKQGAQTILLAGTDLSSFYADEPPGFPCLDIASLHIKQIWRSIAAAD